MTTDNRISSEKTAEAIDDSAEDLSLNEIRQTTKQEKQVRYNQTLTVEAFACIIIRHYSA